MIRISQKDLDTILEVAERAARRTGRKVVIHWGRIILVDR